MSGPYSVCSLASSLSGIFQECGGSSPHVRSSPCRDSQAPVLRLPAEMDLLTSPESSLGVAKRKESPWAPTCILDLGPKPTLKQLSGLQVHALVSFLTLLSSTV